MSIADESILRATERVLRARKLMHEAAAEGARAKEELNGAIKASAAGNLDGRDPVVAADEARELYWRWPEAYVDVIKVAYGVVSFGSGPHHHCVECQAETSAKIKNRTDASSRVRCERCETIEHDRRSADRVAARSRGEAERIAATEALRHGRRISIEAVSAQVSDGSLRMTSFRVYTDDGCGQVVADFDPVEDGELVMRFIRAADQNAEETGR